MKKRLLLLLVILASVSMLVAFSSTSRSSSIQSGIIGKVSPPDGAEIVWAIGTTDTTRGAVSSGGFSLQVKPGTYKLIVTAKAPFKDVVLENLEVGNRPLDIGEIVLQ